MSRQKPARFGMHGRRATATAAATLSASTCTVYMGSEDIRRQNLNVFRMKLMGAKVVEVTSGSKTLKDATNEAMRDWMSSVGNTHYIIGSVIGPHPFPMLVRDFQSMIGTEARAQCLEIEVANCRTTLIACVGGGKQRRPASSRPFVNDKDVKLIGVEAGGNAAPRHGHSTPPRFMQRQARRSARMSHLRVAR